MVGQHLTHSQYKKMVNKEAQESYYITFSQVPKCNYNLVPIEKSISLSQHSAYFKIVRECVFSAFHYLKIVRKSKNPKNRFSQQNEINPRTPFKSHDYYEMVITMFNATIHTPKKTPFFMILLECVWIALIIPLSYKTEKREKVSFKYSTRNKEVKKWINK